MRKIIYSSVQFLLYISFSYGMDQSPILKKLATAAATAKFIGDLPIWNDKVVTPSVAKLSHSIPSALIITPDEKGVVMSYPGSVKYIALPTTTFEAINQKPRESMVKVLSEQQTIIKHAHAAYYPVIAVAESEKNLIVVSVLNSEDQITPKAECIISYNQISSAVRNKSGNMFCNAYFERKEIDAAVQAVTLSSDGKILAIALTDHIHIFDLESSSDCKKFFIPRAKGVDRVVDISEPVQVFPPFDGRHIASVNNLGVIGVKIISKTDDIVSCQEIKNMPTGESIERIHLLHDQDILYVTTNGEVKITNLNDWLEHFQGKVKNRIISRHQDGNAALDQSLNYGTIHWVADPDRSESDRSNIYIHRENGPSVEDFNICIKNYTSKKYSFLTVAGQKKMRFVHIMAAALRGDTVLALLADGNLCCWSLPAKHQPPTELMVTNPDPSRNKQSPVLGKRDKQLVYSPSSPQISRKARHRSSTEGGDSDHSRDSVKLTQVKKSDGGSKEKVKGSSSPRGNQEKAWNYGKKKSRDENGKGSKGNSYLETLAEDISNNLSRNEG